MHTDKPTVQFKAQVRWMMEDMSQATVLIQHQAASYFLRVPQNQHRVQNTATSPPMDLLETYEGDIKEPVGS